ncbi:Histidine--tRNA ligase (Fragment), partial [Durusdinium trenchii]
ERCQELNLPWALIDAAQRRWINEKMNMGQDYGGAIEKEDPFKKLLEANRQRMTDKSVQQALPGMIGVSPGVGGMSTPPLAGMAGMNLGAMEDQLGAILQRAMMPFQEQVMQKLEMMNENMQRQLETTQEAISQRMDFSQVAILQTVNACQVLLHKLDSSQESVVQKMDSMKVSVDNLLNHITGASDTTKQALLDTVTNSSSVLLQKLDSTQQDLLKQSTDSFKVLEGVASKQDVLSKKVDSGNEFTQRRLVEMESTMDRKMTETSDSVCKAQTDSTQHLLVNLRGDLAKLAEQGNAMVDATEKSSAVQEERMADVRRQNMMIMDMLTNAQETMHTSAESLQSFTRSEIMRDSATNMEMQLREVIVKQMGKMQEALLGGDEDEGKGTNLKSAVTAMVERLEDSAQRLELATATGAQGGGSAEMEDLIRRELGAVALALSQQQRDTAQESMVQVGETVRGELSTFKEAQVGQVSEVVTVKLSEFSDKFSENIQRIESGVDKVLQSVEKTGEGGRSGGRSGASRGDR